MAVLTINSLGFAPTSHIDARVLGFRTFLDDEYYQYFTAAISGLDQVTALSAGDEESEALMWRSAASVAVDQIRAAVIEGARCGNVPKADPTQGLALVLDLSHVRQRMVSGDLLPATIDVGAVLASFEV